MMEKMGVCGWVCWLIGLVGAIIAFRMSVGEATWIPALLIAIAVGAFLALVLSHLFCGGAGETHEIASPDMTAVADPEPETAHHSALAEEVLAEAEAGDRDAARDALAAAEAAKPIGKPEVHSALAEEVLAEAEAGDRDAGRDALEAEKAATPDYDKDGVREGEDEGRRPEALSGPRGGAADDLKAIKGVGPKLEQLCNELGFYHFDQIAGWSADEVAWVDANLKGFKGRVSRDNWVEQAKILAAGGETDFSRRVGKGEVY